MDINTRVNINVIEVIIICTVFFSLPTFLLLLIGSVGSISMHDYASVTIMRPEVRMYIRKPART